MSIDYMQTGSAYLRAIGITENRRGIYSTNYKYTVYFLMVHRNWTTFMHTSQNKYLFVGERRSLTAQSMGATWQTCQENGRGVLCARPLFEALLNAGINPSAQVFINLWNDDNSLNADTEQIIKHWRGSIVGMGRRVQKELTRLNIEYIAIIHPAARGKIRKTVLYQQHIKEMLTKHD